MKTKNNLLIQVISLVLFVLLANSCTSIQTKYEQAVSSMDTSRIIKFINEFEEEANLPDKYPKEAKYVNDAKIILDSLNEENNWNTIKSNMTIFKLEQHKKAYPNCNREQEIEKYIRSWYYNDNNKQDSAFKVLRRLSIYNSPLKEVADIIIGEEYDKDMRLFKENISMKSLKEQEEWLEGVQPKYRKTMYEKQIKKRLATINDEIIKKIISGEHGILPKPDKISNKNCSSPVTKLEIFNGTSYTLTVRYSGVESKRVVLNSKQHKVIKLKNGEYNVTATVNASNVTDYAGAQTMDGCVYSSKFIITTTPVYYNYPSLRIPNIEDYFKNR